MRLVDIVNNTQSVVPDESRGVGVSDLCKQSKGNQMRCMRRKIRYASKKGQMDRVADLKKQHQRLKQNGTKKGPKGDQKGTKKGPEGDQKGTRKGPKKGPKRERRKAKKGSKVVF